MRTVLGMASNVTLHLLRNTMREVAEELLAEIGKYDVSDILADIADIDDELRKRGASLEGVTEEEIEAAIQDTQELFCINP